MVILLKFHPLTLIERTQGDVHIGAPEADVGEPLLVFTEAAQAIQEVTGGAVRLKFEPTLLADRSIALLPTVLHHNPD